MSESSSLPPGQQKVGPDKWPFVGEREPLPPPSPWTLDVHWGSLTHQFTLDQLKQLPVTTRKLDIHCVTRWSKLGVTFTGVSLATLVDNLEISIDTWPYISFVAHTARQHSTSLSLIDALQLETILAWEVDGKPLPAEHGGPLRNIVPGRYFYKSVKWLKQLDLLQQDRLGYWESDAGYHNHADPWQEERYLAPSLDKRQARELLLKKNFDDLDLRGLRAENRDLQDLSARGALLRDAHFENAQLQRADFRGANLSNAHLAGAQLQGARFDNADLEGTDFTNADLRNVCWKGASLFGASFITGPNSRTRLSPGAISEKQIQALTDEQAAWVRQQQ